MNLIYGAAQVMRGIRVKLYRTTVSLFSVVCSLLLVLLSCEQPAGVVPVTQPPIIGDVSGGGSWDVQAHSEITLTVTATSPDGGALTYQWYRSFSADAAEKEALEGKTGAALTLAKADYGIDGVRYFYAEVTNRGTAQAGKVVAVAVTGNVPYEIGSREELARIGGEYPLSGSYVLTRDLILDNWRPIGDKRNPFTGIFDGGGKTITLNSFSATALANSVYLGIFGYVRGDSVGAKAAVRNLKIHSTVDQENQGGMAVGLAAGYAEMAELSGITLSGSFTLLTRIGYLGGAVGYVHGAGALVKNVVSDMAVDITPKQGSGYTLEYGLVLATGDLGIPRIGGIVGFFMLGAGIEQCHNTGNIKAVTEYPLTQMYVGGIAGGTYHAFDTRYHGYIRESSFVGDIEARCTHWWTIAGGIVGILNGNGTTVERCFAKGTVSVWGARGTVFEEGGTEFPYAGGITGYGYGGARTVQCYFDGVVLADERAFSIGGIDGYHGTVEECWVAGTVRGGGNAGIGGSGGGRNYSGAVYYNGSGVQTGAGAGLPASQAGYAGWDFGSVWKWDGGYEGGRPVFQWR